MANDLQLRVLLSAIDRATAPLRRIMQGSDATARALKATRERLKQLNAQQSDVRAFRTQRGALEQVSTALAAQQARVKALAQQMAAAGNPTRALTRDYNRAIREAGFLKQQHLQQSQALQQLRTRLSNAGISTRNLGQHERDLRAQIQAANGAINSQAQRLRNLSQQQERLTHARNTYSRGIQSAAALAGTGMAARATGMYTGDKLRQMLGVGYEFDATMSATQAVTRIERKDDPQMQALRQQARTLPLSSKFTDKEVAQGQYFLGRTGYNAKQILGAMPGMLNLAAAGDMDLGASADIASNIQTAMGIPAEKMDQVADVLTAAFTRNNVDIRMLGDSLKYSAGVGRRVWPELGNRDCRDGSARQRRRTRKPGRHLNALGAHSSRSFQGRGPTGREDPGRQRQHARHAGHPQGHQRQNEEDGKHPAWRHLQGHRRAVCRYRLWHTDASGGKRPVPIDAWQPG